MATSLLDGTSAAFNMTTGSTPVSWKDIAAYVSVDMGNEMFEQTAFGNSGWRSRIRGLKQLVGRVAGFMSKGLAISDPSALFSGSGPTPCVITWDTGITTTFLLNPRNDHSGMQAAGNSERGLDFESFGAVVWVAVTS